MGYRLGNLEETVLLILLLMKDEAYGVSVRDVYVDQTGHDLSLSAIHTVLRRLEKKKLIKSSLGGATQDRGGRRKRLYQVTRLGYQAAHGIQEERTRLWNMIPRFDIGY